MRGLDTFLTKISENPHNDIFTERFIALLSEQPDEVKVRYLMKLGTLLSTNNPLMALKVSQIAISGLSSLENALTLEYEILGTVQHCFKVLGKAGKAEVVGIEKSKLAKRIGIEAQKKKPPRPQKRNLDTQARKLFRSENVSKTPSSQEIARSKKAEVRNADLRIHFPEQELSAKAKRTPEPQPKKDKIDSKHIISEAVEKDVGGNVLNRKLNARKSDFSEEESKENQAQKGHRKADQQDNLAKTIVAREENPEELSDEKEKPDEVVGESFSENDEAPEKNTRLLRLDELFDAAPSEDDNASKEISSKKAQTKDEDKKKSRFWSLARRKSTEEVKSDEGGASSSPQVQDLKSEPDPKSKLESVPEPTPEIKVEESPEKVASPAVVEDMAVVDSQEVKEDVEEKSKQSSDTDKVDESSPTIAPGEAVEFSIKDTEGTVGTELDDSGSQEESIGEFSSSDSAEGPIRTQVQGMSAMGESGVKGQMEFSLDENSVIFDQEGGFTSTRQRVQEREFLPLNEDVEGTVIRKTVLSNSELIPVEEEPELIIQEELLGSGFGSGIRDGRFGVFWLDLLGQFPIDDRSSWARSIAQVCQSIDSEGVDEICDGLQAWYDSHSEDGLQVFVQNLFRNLSFDDLQNLFLECQLPDHGVEAWQDYLDLLIDTGRSRSALYDIRGRLKGKARLPWVELAYTKLLTIWDELGYRGFDWEPEDGVRAFIEKISTRSELKASMIFCMGSGSKEKSR